MHRFRLIRYIFIINTPYLRVEHFSSGAPVHRCKPVPAQRSERRSQLSNPFADAITSICLCRLLPSVRCSRRFCLICLCVAINAGCDSLALAHSFLFAARLASRADATFFVTARGTLWRVCAGRSLGALDTDRFVRPPRVFGRR